MFKKSLPTTDLYFLHSCQALVQSAFDKSRPIKRIGHNSFLSGKKILIIRKDKKPVLDHVVRLVTEQGYELLYLIDDNIWQAGDDDSLSRKYQKSMQKFHESIAIKLINYASQVFVGSSNLRQFIPPNKNPQVVRPAWPLEPPVGHHFDYAHKHFDLTHVGTNSHRAGFQFILPVVEALLATYPQLHFTYHSNVPLMGQLDKHPRVRRKHILRWWFYHRYMGKFHYHLALYPIVATPINQGRSINKILEHPLCGCSAVYSEEWQQSKHIKETSSGLVLPNDAEIWTSEIGTLIENPDLAKDQYRRAMQSFYKLNSLSSQRDFWQEYFISSL